MKSPHLLLLLLALVASGLAVPAAADEPEPYIAVVTGDDVYVRSGAADSYYPFGRANTGDLVKVTGERFNWARVHTFGPTFTSERFFGYIIYPTSQPGRFRISDDGNTGTTLGRMDVLAPNLNTNHNPNDSWKPLIRLDADTNVKVLETTTTANNTVHKIVLPDSAEAWISMAYLEEADEKQQQAWDQAINPQQHEQQRDRDEPNAAPSDEDAPTEDNAVVQRVEDTADQRDAAEDSSDPAERTVDESDDDSQDRDVSDEDESSDAADEETAVEDDAATEADVKPDTETTMPALGNVEDADETQRDAAQDDDAADAEPSLSERIEEATLDDLEQAYERLREAKAEDDSTAEITPLRDMYRQLATRLEEEDESGSRFARARAEQLDIWADAQARRLELDEIRKRASIAAERTDAARLAADAGGDYIAVGRLTSSTIYDGRRLPRLLRVQDPGTGRTVAYLQPNDAVDTANLLGQLVGVIGEKEYDGSLRLNVLTARRVDLLAPR